MSDDLREFLARARASTSASAARVVSLDELRAGHQADAEEWGLPALRGRLVELSARGATATLTAAVGLVLEAQGASEPVAWVTTHGSFYPPDVADSGVDLAALVVVRVPSTPDSAVVAARTAERLLRSGAFGLIVLDLVGGASNANEISMAHQGRLVTLAQAHDAAVVCLTDKTRDTASIGSLVSLRVEALRSRATNGFELTVRALKDKRRGPSWTRSIKVRGPAGM
ncbi:MAG TPA: recombinase A [Kofleriaceae bacterium]